MIETVFEKMRSNYSMKSIANEYGLSVCNVNRIFDWSSYEFTGLPMIFSIDEFKGKIKLANILLFSDTLRMAYVLKEKFIAFVNSANSVEAACKLTEWLSLVK